MHYIQASLYCYFVLALEYSATNFFCFFLSMVGTRKRGRGFEMNEETKPVIVEVCNENKGLWKDIMKDDRIKSFNCSRQDIQPVVDEYLEAFDRQFYELCGNKESTNAIKEIINDWKVDPLCEVR